jgi:hypothetical protein
MLPINLRRRDERIAALRDTQKILAAPSPLSWFHRMRPGLPRAHAERPVCRTESTPTTPEQLDLFATATE